MSNVQCSVGGSQALGDAEASADARTPLQPTSTVIALVAERIMLGLARQDVDLRLAELAVRPVLCVCTSAASGL